MTKQTKLKIKKKKSTLHRYHLKPTELKRAERIFAQIKKHVPKEYHGIQLCVTTDKMKEYDSHEGGFATPGVIVIGSTYLNTHKNDIAVAEIIAHELAHHIMGHVLTDDLDPISEHDADHVGMMLCAMAGYSMEAYIAHFAAFEQERSKTLSKRHIKDHGTGSERLEKLEAQKAYLKESLS